MVTNITDRLLLKKIYDLYYQDFCKRQDKSDDSSAKIYIPIDCNLIAEKLKINPQIVFGRLYYSLDKKYRYKQENGSSVSLFSLKVGEERHCIHFPMLSAVLAELEQSYYRFTIPIGISLFALAFSILGIVTG